MNWLTYYKQCTVNYMVYPKVVEHFEQRGSKEDVVVHVINIDIQDNQEEATIGAYLPEGEHHSRVFEIQYYRKEKTLVHLLGMERFRLELLIQSPTIGLKIIVYAKATLDCK
jgi:hypothetical protein